LLAAERQHRDALATVSTLVAAGESVRLDRWVFVLTLVLGAVAVIAALPQIAAIVSAVLRQLGLD
jgi:energy-converting hydrogenase Eha subunit H